MYRDTLTPSLQSSADKCLIKLLSAMLLMLYGLVMEPLREYYYHWQSMGSDQLSTELSVLHTNSIVV